MTATYTIEFSVNDTIFDSDEKSEAIVESIIDEFIPAVAMTTGACPDEIAVRLMIELSFQIGATHSPASILGVLAAMTEAARAGQAVAVEEEGSSNVSDDALSDMECVPGTH